MKLNTDDGTSHTGPNTSRINLSSSSSSLERIDITESTTIEPSYTLGDNDKASDNGVADDKASNTITIAAVALGIIALVCVLTGQLIFAGVYCRRNHGRTTPEPPLIHDQNARTTDDAYLHPVTLTMEPIISRPEISSPIYGLGRISRHTYDVIDEDPYETPHNDAADGYETIPDEALDPLPPARNMYISIIGDKPKAEMSDVETSVDYSQHLYVNTPTAESGAEETVEETLTRKPSGL